jgi:hypothetical protein
MHWVLQGGGLFTAHEWEALTGTLERFGIPYSVHTVVPFVGELHPDIDVPDGRAICFGSYSMRHVAAAKKWMPGVYDLVEFDFEVQRAKWGEHLLNFGSKVSTFGSVGFDSPKFVRPIDDSKVFAGRVFEPGEFAEWQPKVASLGQEGPLTTATLVQVSDPQTIYREVRYWVVGGEIVARSVYKTGETVHYEDRVDGRYDAFAREVIAIWQPLEAFVLDVCETQHGFRIVEINTINSAGFYAADIQNIVLALEALNAD